MSDYVKETTEVVEVLNEKNPGVVLSDGTQVQVKKCKVKQIGLVLQFLSVLMSKLNIDTADDVTSASNSLSNPATMLSLVAESADSLYPVAIALCDLDKEAFMDLEVDDAIDVMMAEWVLNRDFFLQKIAPMMQQPVAVTKASSKTRSTRKKRAS